MKEEIQTYDARKISPDIRESVEELLKKNKESFDPKVILGLCSLATIFMFVKVHNCCVFHVKLLYYLLLKVNGYTFMGSNSVNFIFASLLNGVNS